MASESRSALPAARLYFNDTREAQKRTPLGVRSDSTNLPATRIRNKLYYCFLKCILYLYYSCVHLDFFPPLISEVTLACENLCGSQTP